MLCMFSALHHTSILLVLCWMCTANEVIEAGFNYLVHGMRPSQETGSLLSVALGATGEYVYVYVCVVSEMIKKRGAKTRRPRCIIP